MKFIAGIAACVIAGSVSWGGLSYAQERAPLEDRDKSTVGTAPALRAAVDAAWERALSAQESQGVRQRAEAERSAAARLWAAPPALEIQHRNDRLQSNVGKRETEVAIAWPLWLPRQRASNEARAQAGVERADAAERVARLQVAAMVRESAWRLIAERSERDELARQVDVLRKLHDDVERRVRAGDLARADALAARSEWLAVQAQLSETEQRAEEARIRWRELTGIEELPRVEGLRESDAATANPRHPEVELAERGIELARRRLDYVRASTRDAPELTVGMRQDISGGVEGTHNSLQLGIRVPFGTSDRNRPLEAAAASELDIAQASVRRLRLRIEADIAAARAAVRAAERQAQVEQERMQLLGERARLLDRAFRAGESALPEVLRALGATSQARGAAARQAVLLELARARLNQAYGVLP